MLMNKIYENVDELCTKTAAWFADEAAKAIEARGRFLVALSGGSTPKRLFAELAKDEWKSQIEWSKIFFFWGDERFVAPEDELSNQKMTRKALLDHVPVPEKNIFPMPFLATPQQSADKYEETLKQIFSTWPVFDLVFLGLGADGHTASLFPQSPALLEKTRWVAPSKPIDQAVERVTLTYPVLNRGRIVCFLVTGSEKAVMVKNILQGSVDVSFPAKGIKPEAGELVWILDRAAAQLLV
jgi:6-phosphogluconolactonase